MVASTDIKFYVHTNNNAPQLQNAYGSMIGVLDACLINGINIGTVSSLAASGTTVTALFSSAHNLMQYQVIKITGANQSEFNGEHRILTVPNAQSITFELAAAPSTTAATGTIEASLPPLGWEKPLSSVNANGGGKAAYRSMNLLLPSRPFLRVVDELDPAYTASYAKYAKVGIIEDMTDIDTMLGVQAPYDVANPDKNWVGSGSGDSCFNGWSKWVYARSATAIDHTQDSQNPSNGERAWVLLGNSDFFYILPANSPNFSILLMYGFGAFSTTINTDSSNTFLMASTYYGSASVGRFMCVHTPGTSSQANNLEAPVLIQRKYNQNGVYACAHTQSLQLSSLTTVYSGGVDYINSAFVANSVPFAPVILMEAESTSDASISMIRGGLPNLNWLFQRKPYPNLSKHIDSNVVYLAVDVALRSANQGQVLFSLGRL
ncbi:hypothetical protein [Acinetobacter variabilis]|uniref:hypothetical protein n=1 Tax=Acinetobacter variabilis TaxID=70346 RepID=UPI0021BF4690|nr:hypothetical protein [Acinetobacter variabilis]UXI52697.1 hypothetical protein N5980_07080 [Acinetobacter variabilis]